MALSEQQREELARRKQEIQRRRSQEKAQAELESRRSQLLPIESALANAQVAFAVIDLRSDQKWLPRWIPDGYGRIPWQLAPSTDYSAHDPDWDGTQAVVEQALRRLAEPEDELLLIFEHPWLAISLPCGAAIDHLPHALVAVRRQWGEMWISDRGGQWIIRCTHDHTLACLPVAREAEEIAAERRRRREMGEAIEDLLEVLEPHQVRHWTLFPGGRRDAAMVPPPVDWRNADKSLSEPLPDDPQLLHETVRGFLRPRCEQAEKIQLHVHGVRIDVEPEAFLQHLPAFLDRYRLYRPTLMAGDRGEWQLLMKGKWLYGCDDERSGA